MRKGVLEVGNRFVSSTKRKREQKQRSKTPLFLLSLCVVGYPPNWGKWPRYIDIDRQRESDSLTFFFVYTWTNMFPKYSMTRVGSGIESTIPEPVSFNAPYDFHDYIVTGKRRSSRCTGNTTEVGLLRQV